MKRETETAWKAGRGKEDLYHAVFDGAPDGMVVVDSGGKIILANDQAAKMFDYQSGDLNGMSVEDLVPVSLKDTHREHRKHYHRFPRVRPFGTHLDIVGKKRGGEEFVMDIMLRPLGSGAELEVLAVLRDVTRDRAEREARERLVRQLEDALNKVKTLTGLLPICAWCKRIRDDHGYWNRLEEYFREHSNLDFTHGICPECARKLLDGRWKQSVGFVREYVRRPGHFPERTAPGIKY